MLLRNRPRHQEAKDRGPFSKVRVAPIRSEVIINATRTREVLEAPLSSTAVACSGAVLANEIGFDSYVDDLSSVTAWAWRQDVRGFDAH